MLWKLGFRIFWSLVVLAAGTAGSLTIRPVLLARRRPLFRDVCSLRSFVVLPDRMAMRKTVLSEMYLLATRSHGRPTLGNYCSGNLPDPVWDNDGSEKFLHGDPSIYCSTGQDAIVLVAKRHHEFCQNNTTQYRSRS